MRHSGNSKKQFEGVICLGWKKEITFTKYVNIKYNLSTSSAPYIDQENYMPMFLICYIHHGILLDHCQTCY